MGASQPADRAAPAVEARALTVHQRRGNILTRVDLSIPATGVVVIGGPNGAGKSTLLSCLATLRAPDAGEVRVAGKRLDAASAVVAARRRIGYLPQEPSAPAGFSIEDLFQYCGWLAGLRGDRLVQAIAAAAARAGLDVPLRQLLKRLSVGQRRRTFVAAASIADSPLLLLDEPANGLDVTARIELRSQLRALAREHAVVVASHAPEDFEQLADRVVVLSEGVVAYAGARADFLALGSGAGNGTNRPGDAERALLAVAHQAQATPTTEAPC